MLILSFFIDSGAFNKRPGRRCRDHFSWEHVVDPEGASETIIASDSSSQQAEQDAKGLSGTQFKDPRDEITKSERFWAWATVVSAFLLQLRGFGYATAFGVFQDFYVREYLTRSTASQISWISSSQTFILLSMGVLSGRLFDKGYCYHLLIGGSVVHILSLWFLSLAQPERYYQIFLSQGIGVGIGAGLTYAPSIAIISQHFSSPTARARAMGAAISGVSLGGLVHPILLNSLLHKRGSGGFGDARRVFQRATCASAGLITGLTVIAILLLRTRYPTKVVVKETEKGEKDIQNARSISFKGLVRRFVTDRPYMCFVIGTTLFETMAFFAPVYLQLYSIKHGLNPDFAFYSLSILDSASFFGRLISGFFTHRLGVANVLLFSIASVAAIMFSLLAVRSVAGVAVFAALFGFVSGIVYSLCNPMLVLLSEGASEIGVRMGMCFAISGFGSLIGAPIAGALLTSKFVWWRPIVFSGCMCVASFLMFTACRIMLGIRKGSLWII